MSSAGRSLGDKKGRSVRRPFSLGSQRLSWESGGGYEEEARSGEGPGGGNSRNTTWVELHFRLELPRPSHALFPATCFFVLSINPLEVELLGYSLLHHKHILTLMISSDLRAQKPGRPLLQSRSLPCKVRERSQPPLNSPLSWTSCKFWFLFNYFVFGSRYPALLLSPGPRHSWGSLR